MSKLKSVSINLNIKLIFFSYSWFHGSITRDEAEHLLQPREDGLFLVRESTNFPGDYTLCVCFQGKVEHYRVKYLDNKLTIDDEEYFENLGQLVAVSIRLILRFVYKLMILEMKSEWNILRVTFLVLWKSMARTNYVSLLLVIHNIRKCGS